MRSVYRVTRKTQNIEAESVTGPPKTGAAAGISRREPELGPGHSMGFVSVEVLAEELHISARRIQQLVKLGMPRDARGRYDISACRAWHRRYLRGRLVPPGRSAARLARLNAENRLLELEFADRKSRVVEWSRIETLNAEMVATIHAELLALPGELAPAIAGESDPLAVGRILSAAIRASLARLASQVHATAP